MVDHSKGVPALPLLLPLAGLNKYQKSDFTSSTVAFYQKSLFDLLNPFTNISGYLNLWNIFRFILRQLIMNFFHKIMMAENIIFLHMHNTISEKQNNVNYQGC